MISSASHAKPGAMLRVEGRSLVWNPVCLSNRRLTKLQMFETVTGLCQNIHSFCSTIPDNLAFIIMKYQEVTREAQLSYLPFTTSPTTQIPFPNLLSPILRDQCEFTREARITFFHESYIQCNSVRLITWQLFCLPLLPILLHIGFWKGY